MKQICLIGLIVVFLILGCDRLFAYDGALIRNAILVTVAEVKTLRDDIRVKLRGSIEKNTQNEKYEFRDSTGSIIVEINNEVWRKNAVDPTSLVFPFQIEITGEHEKARGKSEIDVEKIRKL